MSLSKVSGGDSIKENSIDKVNVKKGYLVAKRCMDVIGALCGLILLSPVFIIVAMLIKYEDSRGLSFSSKFVLEKMEKNFICINFVLWSLMQKRG